MAYEVNITTFKKWCERQELQLHESTSSAKQMPEKESSGILEKIDAHAIVDEIYNQYRKNMYIYKKVDRLSAKKPIFRFSRGAFFAGQLDYEIYSDGGRYYFKNFCGNYFCKMKNYVFEVPRKELARIDEILIKAKDWMQKYRPEFDCMDGYGWSIEFHHSNISVDSQGYVAYPDNYHEVVVELQVLMEELCRKYAEDYTEEGIEERLRL